MNKIVAIIVLSVTFSSPLLAQGDKRGMVISDTPLYEKPFSDATKTSMLRADSMVHIIKRKGGWYQIENGTQVTGWVRMSTLRFGVKSGGKRAGDISGLKQTIKLFKTGRSGTNGVTVATGIRGLDATDLKNSKPNYRAIKRLSTFMTTEDASRNFASRAKLKSQKVDFIQLDRAND